MKRDKTKYKKNWEKWKDQVPDATYEEWQARKSAEWRQWIQQAREESRRTAEELHEAVQSPSLDQAVGEEQEPLLAK